MAKKPRVPNSGSFKPGDPRCGRPTIYTHELGIEIAKQLGMGKSLRRICLQEGMPEIHTCLDWALRPEHPFSSQYETGRQMQAEYMADELQDIADDGTNDFMINERGNEVINTEHVQRSRLRVDTRKWIASKLKPKRYGDKLQTEHSGKVTLEDFINATNAPKSKE